VFGAISLGLLAGFFLREARARTPLVPLRIFRSRNVSGANLVQMLMVAGLLGMFFLGAVYMQRVLGYSPLQVGLAFLPVALAIGVLSLSVAPRLNMRIGPRATLLPGLVLIAIGLMLFAIAPVHADYLRNLLPVMLLIGTGAGLSFPSLTTIAMSGATQSDSGLASGLVNTSLQVGGALGLAVLATLSSTRADRLVASGSSASAALAGGLHLALAIGAGLVVAAIITALTVLTPASAVQATATASAETAYPEEQAAYPEAA
jgi:predicted MFS family arabinose efflux permease